MELIILHQSDPNALDFDNEGMDIDYSRAGSPVREPEVPSQDDDESAHTGAKMVAFCAAFVMVLTYHLDPPPLPPAEAEERGPQVTREDLKRTVEYIDLLKCLTRVE